MGIMNDLMEMAYMIQIGKAVEYKKDVDFCDVWDD